MNILIEKNVMVPMRDGIKLATDVYRPDEGGPVPVLLSRLPYSKELPTTIQAAIDTSRAVQAGYAVVFQDCRGRSGKLVDVYPDGRAEILTDGILRARYRESFSEPKLMEPGHIYELHLDLWATSNLFKAGHRIRLEVTSSNFPRFDRNTNSGGTIEAETERDVVQAVNRIHHDSAHPSHLILPIIERD